MKSWIIQTNPETFFIDFFLDNYQINHLDEKDWYIIHKKHNDCVMVEDELFIWKAKSQPSRSSQPEYYQWRTSIGRFKPIAGIVAKCSVTDKPISFSPCPEYLEKTKKYRGQELPFGPKDYMVYCKYPKSSDIRVRNLLSQEEILAKIGGIPETAFGSFLKHPRGRRSILLEPWEADIIRSLFSGV